MSLLTEVSSNWMSYQPALIALSLLCLSVLIQSFLTAPLAFLKQEQVPGMPLKGDHTLLSFRVLRTHMNSVESLSPFGFTLVVAILFEAHVSAVNWLAMIHLAFRLLYWGVYYSGIGKVAGGLRTLGFVGGMLSNMALLIVALFSLT